TIMRAHGCCSLFALLGLAIERLIDRLAEGVPQLLLEPALQRHSLRLGLPSLLESFYGIDTQHRCRAKRLCLGDHGLATLGAGFLRHLKRSRSRVNGLLPQRLKFCKGFLSQMAGIAPPLGELMQLAIERFPVCAFTQPRIAGAPSLDLFDQEETLSLVGSGFGAYR